MKSHLHYKVKGYKHVTVDGRYTTTTQSHIVWYSSKYLRQLHVIDSVLFGKLLKVTRVFIKPLYTSMGTPFIVLDGLNLGIAKIEGHILAFGSHYMDQKGR